MIAPLTETGHLSSFGALVVAPLLGMAFGWCLERGGLGSAPRLAAQFYLTDLRVFKIMFSALLTAMLGAFWLDHFGLLDLKLVSIPETFLLPQAIGGALFGAGFLVAGLCPGTACVAAATARIDGAGVVGGLFLGVTLFNLCYRWVEHLYLSTPRNTFTLPSLLGVSQGIAIALVTLFALGGFATAQRIQRSRA